MRRDRVESELRELLEDAVGENRMVRADDFVNAGIPRRHAESLARASKDLMSTEDARELAADWARQLTSELDQHETDPRKLAEHIPRF